MKSRKGMFLGAGASYDFGFPLVWHLTKEIRDWLTPDKLSELNNSWKKQGGGMLDETIEITSALLTNSDLHYEQMIGALEVETSRIRGNNLLYQNMHHMRSWLVELVSILLVERQCKNDVYISKTLELYKRFKDFVDVDYPFWIFTTNHDLNIEILATHFGINYKTGLYDRELSFPLIDNNQKSFDRIKFYEFDVEKFNTEPMNFMNNINDRGINIFKLHGSLDIFLYSDNKKYIKINFGDCKNYNQVISRLRDVNQRLEFSPTVKCTNEIVFADDQGVMQFLRRSVLTGMHKFEDANGQNIPKEILPLFKSHINFVNELYVIGYGFGDIHINYVLRKWISFSADRKMIIVNPNMKTLPDEFKIYVGQIEIIQENFLQFLARETNTPLSLAETFINDLRNKSRRNLQI